MLIDRLGGAEVHVYPDAAHKSTGLGLTYVQNKSPIIGDSSWIGLGGGRNELKAAETTFLSTPTAPEATAPLVCPICHLNVQENRVQIRFPPWF